jgi:cobalt-zinc-cadmium efflux system protein
VLGWSLAIHAGFLAVEAAVGWWTGSLALLSDAAHMLSDVAALGLAAMAARVALRPADAAHTFGFGRAEVLGGFVNALAQLLLCAWIAVEAVGRLRGEAPEIAGWPVLFTAVGGLLVNLASAWALSRGDRGDLNIRGALLHVLGDALGSVGAIVAAVALLFGVGWADAAVSLLVAGLVLVAALRLLREAGAVLLQRSPPGFPTEAVRAALAGMPGVDEVHDLHAWTMDGRYPLVTAHLVAAPGLGAAGEEALRFAAVELLRREHGVLHATVQVERHAADGGLGCPMDPCDGPKPPALRGRTR